MEKEYYYISISNFWFIFWIVLGAIITILSAFSGFLILLVPLVWYFYLKNCKYYYNNEKLIIEKGIFNKKQYIIPLYRIINIRAEDNIFNFGIIYIQDKGQTILLKYVKHSKNEMLNLTDVWENAKKDNIRNEVI